MKILIHNWTKASLIFAGLFLVLCALAYGWFRFVGIRGENRVLSERVGVLEGEVQKSRVDLTNERKQNSDLNEALQNEQERNNTLNQEVTDIAGKFQQISGTVGSLQKLATTDPEILRKYSEVYFLSENYTPAQLLPINSEYIFGKEKEQFLTNALPFLNRMFEAAKADGVDLKIVSAYRSFFEQASVKNGYKLEYGYGANQFSADQGYSEHQLGTTVDMTTKEISGLTTKFDTTKAFKWLKENAYKYGFIISYPKSNTYFQYEPWHWRFVGVGLATKLHSESKYFYDLTQREINEYLIKLFDPS